MVQLQRVGSFQGGFEVSSDRSSCMEAVRLPLL